MPFINIFKSTPMDGQAEQFETLLKCKNVTIERIQSPAMTRSERYNQEQDEWVCLLQGEATIEMGNTILTLHSGETLFIPSGTPHQVLNTSTDPLCIWLAVHIH
ncbi:MAG: cupin domain-containing protein [Pseudomonadota bacterium]